MPNPSPDPGPAGREGAPRAPEGAAGVLPPAPPPGPLSPAPVPAPLRPYGLWATLGAYVLVVLVYLGAGVAVVAGLAVESLARGIEPDPEKLASDGRLVWLSTILTVPCVIALCALLVRLRRGWTLGAYLGTALPGWKAALGWGLATGAFVAVGDLVNHALGRPIVTQDMVESYLTAGCLPLLWIAIVAAAPLGEEVFFRGFFFRGIEATRLGAPGAVVLSSLLWAALHLQYDLYGMFWIFLTGLLLGTARWKTKSVSLAVALHALNNLIATVEVAIVTAA